MKDMKCYQHVLFEDLKDYLNRKDYLAGFTTIEQTYIRRNIGAVGEDDIDRIISEKIVQLHEMPYNEFCEILYQKELIAGSVYIIDDYQTIYSSYNKNNNGQHITWGLDIYPSKTYKLFCMAISSDQLLPQVFIIEEEKVKPWIVYYDPYYKILEDGVKDKGTIYYLEDENKNSANYDFKNILFDFNDNVYHTFSDFSGNDISSEVFGNKINKAYNVIILLRINNLICNYSDLIIKDDIQDMDKDSIKQIIQKDQRYYLDYLDLQTLTHQFYGIAKNIHI